jgi:agmatinase
VAYELVTLMADRAVEGNRFGAANGYAAQALGQESRRPAGFATPASQRAESGVSQ